MMMGDRDLERGTRTKNRNQSHPQSYYAGAYDVDYSDSQWTSWLVPMIIVANVAMFVVIMLVNNCPENHNGHQGGCVAKFLGRLSFQPLRENPLLGPSSSTLDKLGALEWNKIVHENQAWRLVTCIWLHAGVIHLLANMLSLVFIGIRLEQQFGFLRVGAIYLLSGIGGSILSSLFIQRNISVGASGALFGLLGAMLSELLTNWTIYTNKIAALFTLVIIVVINLAVGILPHVDNYAHIGGFLSGFLLGFVLLIRPQFGWLESRHRPDEARLVSKYSMYQYVLLIAATVLWVIHSGTGNAVQGRKCKR
ncbi:RHOMBOID-like protein 3 [Orobanche minor]